MIKNTGLNFSGNFNQDALGVSIPDPYIQDVNPDVDAYIRYLVNREQANFAMITITVNASTGDDSTASLGSGVYATLQKALSDFANSQYYSVMLNVAAGTYSLDSSINFYNKTILIRGASAATVTVNISRYFAFTIISANINITNVTVNQVSDCSTAILTNGASSVCLYGCTFNNLTGSNANIAYQVARMLNLTEVGNTMNICTNRLTMASSTYTYNIYTDGGVASYLRGIAFYREELPGFGDNCVIAPNKQLIGNSPIYAVWG